MSNLRAVISRVYNNEALRAALTRFSLSDPHNQQVFAIVLAIVMAGIIVGTVGYSWVKSAMESSRQGNAPSLPADIYDAIGVCSTEMEQRLGDKLLRSYVDQHSTRLDNSKGIFRIYIKADIGEIRDFHEIDVYCFVDKWDRNLSYYKQIDPTVKQVMTSDLKFFKD